MFLTFDINGTVVGNRYRRIILSPLKKRMSEHKGYINSIFPTQATGEHFNLPGHSMNNVTVTINEKVE